MNNENLNQQKSNSINDDKLSEVSGGVMGVFEEKARVYEVSYMSVPDDVGPTDTCVDPGTGFQIGDVIYIEHLNREFTVTSKSRIDIGYEISIFEKGERKDLYLKARVKKVNK